MQPFWLTVDRTRLRAAVYAHTYVAFTLPRTVVAGLTPALVGTVGPFRATTHAVVTRCPILLLTFTYGSDAVLTVYLTLPRLRALAAYITFTFARFAVERACGWTVPAVWFTLDHRRYSVWLPRTLHARCTRVNAHSWLFYAHTPAHSLHLPTDTPARPDSTLQHAYAFGFHRYHGYFQHRAFGHDATHAAFICPALRYRCPRGSLVVTPTPI